MKQNRKFRKITEQLGREAMLAIIAMLITVAVNAQMKIAVLDFKAGAGVEQGDVDGISAIFGTYFINPQKFILVERTQIDRVVVEQGFQYSSLTNQQMVRVGQILDISRMVVGDVNVVSGQYNVDVRVVNVETGAIEATDGATWARGSSYRELMKNLANNLMSKMNYQTSGTTQSQSSFSQSTKDGITINGITWARKNVGAFENDDYGNQYTFEQAQTVCPKGWRLPTKQEFITLFNAGHSGIVEQNGNKGRKYGDSNKYIFLPYAELFSSEGKEYVVIYWSSTVFDDDDTYAYNLNLISAQGVVGTEKTSKGFVRCVCETK